MNVRTALAAAAGFAAARRAAGVDLPPSARLNLAVIGLGDQGRGAARAHLVRGARIEIDGGMPLKQVEDRTGGAGESGGRYRISLASVGRICSAHTS